MPSPGSDCGTTHASRSGPGFPPRPVCTPASHAHNLKAVTGEQQPQVGMMNSKKEPGAQIQNAGFLFVFFSFCT